MGLKGKLYREKWRIAGRIAQGASLNVVEKGFREKYE